MTALRDPAVGRSTTQIVLEVLRERIVHGWYPPGRHLAAAEVAAELETSRTPVREALLLLESEGLVVSALNRGFRVRPLSPQHISELYDLRAHLESFAARKAAENAAAGHTDELHDLHGFVEEMDGLIGSDDIHGERIVESMMSTNVAIHECIVRASGYPTLPTLIRQTVDRGVIYRAFRLFGREQLRRSNEYHRMIAAQIQAQDPDRAASLMAEHVFQSRDVVLAAIDAAGGDVSKVFGADA
jgi:DNA-binding GntR family transcriptional regulator